MYNQFLNELAAGKFLLADKSYLANMKLFLQGDMNAAPPEPQIKIFSQSVTADLRVSPSKDSKNFFDDMQKNSIAVIPITGTMMKYDSWFSVGMDSIAELIKLADESDNISGIILQLNTPGGSTLSVMRLEETLRNRTKPLVAAVDGLCCSGGIYVASFADKIVALNRMCEIGSIGTFCVIDDFSGAYEQYGIKEYQIYPPESSFKNKGVRDVCEKGDDKYIIETELTPYAIHFQNLIKSNRKKLKTDTEGILEGKVFYAYDAVDNGLIDKIMDFNAAVELTVSLAEQKKALASLF